MNHDPTRLGHRLRALERVDSGVLWRARTLLSCGELSCGAALRLLGAHFKKRGSAARASELDAQACLMALLQRQMIAGRGAPLKRSRWPQRIQVNLNDMEVERDVPHETTSPREHLVQEARNLLSRRAPLPEGEALAALIRSRLAPWGIDQIDTEQVANALAQQYPELFAADPGHSPQP